MLATTPKAIATTGGSSGVNLTNQETGEKRFEAGAMSPGWQRSCLH